MTNSAVRVLRDVDVIAMVIDASQEISTGDLFVLEKVKEAKKTPRVLIVNKIDKINDEELILKRAEIAEKLGEFDAIVEIAGQYAIGVPKLLDALDPFLEDGMKYYPDDMYTDMPMYRVITEVVREKILERTRDEIPHSVAIEIINVTRRNNGKDKFDINIYVERDSQKGIIIGKQGSMLKEIGVHARKDIENLIGVQIYLELWVKVKDDWRKKKPFLKELGYVEER